MFQSPHVRLLANDFPACFRFCRDTLGFVPTLGTEDDVYADFETGGQDIALFARPLMAEAVGMTDTLPGVSDMAVLVLSTKNVDEAAEVLRSKGVALATEPTERPLWGIRTAHFRDPDSHLIEINTPLT